MDSGFGSGLFSRPSPPPLAAASLEPASQQPLFQRQEPSHRFNSGGIWVRADGKEAGVRELFSNTLMGRVIVFPHRSTRQGRCQRRTTGRWASVRARGRRGASAGIPPSRTRWSSGGPPGTHGAEGSFGWQMVGHSYRKGGDPGIFLNPKKHLPPTHTHPSIHNPKVWLVGGILFSRTLNLISHIFGSTNNEFDVYGAAGVA